MKEKSEFEKRTADTLVDWVFSHTLFILKEE